MSVVCSELHKILSLLPRHYLPFEKSLIPLNGIYVLYEDGEVGHGTDRIVRVGIHNRDDRLRKRLNDHFAKENKDRSIFRDNIGMALLNMENDPFLEQWIMSREDRRNHGDSVDKARLKEVERQVTDYIRSRFSFTTIPIKTEKERHDWERRLIPTVAKCKECGPSKNWFGSFSPKLEIRESGMWNSQLLKETPLDFEWLDRLKSIVGQ